MGKRETKESYQDTRQDKVETEERYEEARGDSSDRVDELTPAIGGLNTELSEGYRNLAPAGQLNAPVVGGRSLMKAGDVGLDRFAETYDAYKNLGPAYSDEQRASIGDNVSGLKEIGKTGGVDANSLNRMRGLGGFDEFAETGGYTAAQKADIKAQAISPISSYATGTQDELARRRNLQNGYAPGFDAANRTIQREAARGITDTSLNANIDIQDRVNQGRQWGIGGVAGSELGAQSLITGNKLAGLQGAGNMEMALQDRINQYKLAGLSGQAATAAGIADIEKFNIGNTQAVDSFNIGNENSLGMFNAGNQMNAGQFNIQNAQNMNMAGLGGLQGLYNTDVGRQQNELDRQNSLLGGQTQSNLSYLNNQSQLGTQPGVGGNIVNAIGSVAGAAAPMMPVFQSPRSNITNNQSYYAPPPYLNF